ncbi:hypothetical protein FUAX_27020 [Fulvitalea axinellae]|uniref:Uncharacterized protein n=1 Tax=Fulvitalea axinellae TaxID=1182444 RepID=A0AAU9DGU8_9BACT|nr:hypothetical protein FUAX_27020 [Fulvitalea axinellae]
MVIGKKEGPNYGVYFNSEQKKAPNQWLGALEYFINFWINL